MTLIMPQPIRAGISGVREPENAVKDLIHDSLYALLLPGLRRHRLLPLLFRSKTVLLADQLVHRADVLPNDDLQLFAGPLCSGNARQILDLVHLNDAAVLHIEAQPCDAVGKERTLSLPPISSTTLLASTS